MVAMVRREQQLQGNKRNSTNVWNQNRDPGAWLERDDLERFFIEGGYHV